jgi:hypothetical protein
MASLRSAIDAVQRGPEFRDALDVGDLGDRADAGAAGDQIKPGAQSRMADLHSGFVEMTVVEHDDRKVRAFVRGNRQQAADAHQLLAVTCDHDDGTLRARQRDAEADHRRTSHRAPQIEIARVVAGVEHIIGRRSKTAHDQEVATVGEQGLHRLPAIERAKIPCHYRVSVHFLRPSMRCEISTATC